MATLKERAEFKKRYPMFSAYCKPLVNPSKRPIVGRDSEILSVLVNLSRYEISNVALIGEAGVGKTTIMYGVASKDKSRSYFEVDLSLMASSEDGSDGSVNMASRLKKLISEVESLQKSRNREIVLFMDEFHNLVKLSSASVEAIKPILANSGSRHIRIVVATTFEEYNKHIRANEALSERLEPVIIDSLNFEDTLNSLRLYWRTYNSTEQVNDQLLRHIIEVTDKNLPSQAQPRKSIRILDHMFGWHKVSNVRLDEHLLADVFKRSLGVTIDYNVNPDTLASKFNARVFDQTLAVEVIVDRLYISLASLNDDSKPRGSFLFTGSTGVGKTELAKAMASELMSSEDRMIRFDMSEYSLDSSVDSLRKSLTAAIWENPSSIILFDEIEKASSSCSKLTLQLLDDGRMTDEHGRTVSFKDSFVVFTTNEGAKVISDMRYSFASSDNQNLSAEEYALKQKKFLKDYVKVITRALKMDESRFPPELLGRIDAIVPFAPIEEPTRARICKATLRKLSKRAYIKHGVYLHIDKSVEDFIVKEHIGNNDADAGGGREVKRRIDVHVVSQLAEFIVKHRDVVDISISTEGNMAYNNKYDKVGTGRVVIGRWRG